ncbi:DUF4349 domain-containing protein [Pseudalkalibacillus hwajinpoensis]|uniref:DUF4349 domain-containing protein n=1 Tax=Guptibacillus hwajinpoensis TaxID=208199 RepID=UPI00325AE535
MRIFLKKPEKTDDLLAISNDLSHVQEEIEQLKGRMNYLDNQSEFSTVIISIAQKKITVPSISNKELNTLTEAKENFKWHNHLLLNSRCISYWPVSWHSSITCSRSLLHLSP